VQVSNPPDCKETASSGIPKDIGTMKNAFLAATRDFKKTLYYPLVGDDKFPVVWHTYIVRAATIFVPSIKRSRNGNCPLG
jgi:hypothetical protein